MSEFGERFLKYVMSVESDSMDISFHQLDKDGQISFIFPIEGITDESIAQDIVDNSDSLLQAVEPFYANMIGQMIIRKNITKFFEYFRDMSDEDYNSKLMNIEYISFGMGCNDDYVSMVFHGSLLYNIFVALLNNKNTESEK